MLTNKGDISNYLGVNIKKNSDRTFELLQSNLVEKIINHVRLTVPVSLNSRETPEVKPLLYSDEYSLGRKCMWNYRAEAGMLNYLLGLTRPEIALAVHQCAKFINNPRLMHERVVRIIAKNLASTSTYMDLLDENLRLITCGIVYMSCIEKGIKCYVDFDLSSGWDQADSDIAENVMSRTGFLIMYAVCPLFWCSKLQIDTALSTIEA